MEKRMVKRLAAAMLAATVAIGTPMAASAAWRTEGKGWNWTVDGKNATGWQMIENTWYYFNSEGTMQTGWVPYGNSWYFLQPSGAMATGWVQDNGKWYYTKADGAMATGWVQAGDTWYCMSSTGEMRTGWVASGDDWYYLAPTGAMVTDAVIKVDDAVYAIAADGSMQTGEVEIAGETYTFGDDGAATGETIPEPDRSFSTIAAPGGAPVETTPTTPPSDNGGSTTTPTTPTKPSRPSYGGGGGGTTTPEVAKAGITIDSTTEVYTKTGADLGSYTINSEDVVSGTATKITNWTGFSSNVAEQSGYYIVLKITLDPERFTVPGQVVIQGSSLSPITAEALASDPTIVYVCRLGGDSDDLATKKIPITITYGDNTTESRTITFTGVKKAAPETSFAAFGTSDKPLESLGDDKVTSAICEVTVPSPATNGTVSVTGTMEKITSWEKWSTDSTLNSGYFVAVKITPAEISAGNRGTVKYTSLNKTDPNPNPAIFVYRIANASGEKRPATELKVPITISYGSGYEEKTYTLDFTGVNPKVADTPVTLSPAPEKNALDDTSDDILDGNDVNSSNPDDVSDEIIE